MKVGENIHIPLDTQLHYVLKQYHFIKLALLFGFVANNSTQFDSDLDLAVHAFTQDVKVRLIETI